MSHGSAHAFLVAGAKRLTSRFFISRSYILLYALKKRFAFASICPHHADVPYRIRHPCTERDSEPRLPRRGHELQAVDFRSLTDERPEHRVDVGGGAFPQWDVAVAVYPALFEYCQLRREGGHALNRLLRVGPPWHQSDLQR